MHWSDSSVLVTGGAGFVGSRLTRDLLERGADVHVVDDCTTGSRELVPDGATFDAVDVESADLADAVGRYRPDSVIHLAALHFVPYCDEHPGEAYDVNVWGTRTLCEALRDADSVERVAFASSAAVYPPRDGPLSETDTVDPMDVYGRTKVLGEDLLREFARDTGTPVAAARLFNIYGPNETNPHLIPAILDQLDDGHSVELGNLKPRRDFVHVSDVSSAFCALLDAHDAGFRTYNVGTGEAHTVREVVEATSDALGSEITIEQDEERVRESDRPHLQADVSRITSETDWEPTVDLRSGLASLLDERRVIA